MKQMPAKILSAAVYLGGSATMLGNGDITLPSLEAMSETMSGAGIAGEIDVPTSGFYSSLTVDIAWRSVDRAAIKMASTKLHSLDIRGAQQVFDMTLPGMRVEQVKVTIKGLGKTLDLGTFATNSPTDGSTSLEVTYIKIEIGEEKVLELDKLNFIFYVDGSDEMTDVRRALGMQ
ncbi:Phage tail tube protein FII [compost metagenome]